MIWTFLLRCLEARILSGSTELACAFIRVRSSSRGELAKCPRVLEKVPRARRNRTPGSQVFKTLKFNVLENASLADIKQRHK
ncbi:hypothetical protein Q8A67_008621 [Cirrhinus molitorella]|uniref:Secreted protein n=1 Tax=Cirrhinus molitorella TaxID=172907 RepID=A0AA88PXG8_9TELE|nr:hypothetical protein Q8A67_008621 [Cirrhinus molitorella]